MNKHKNSYGYKVKTFKEPSKSIFESACSGLGAKLRSRGLLETQLLKYWKEIVGEDLSEKVTPSRLDWRKGVLELTLKKGNKDPLKALFLSAEILEKVNLYIGKKQIKNITILE